MDNLERIREGIRIYVSGDKAELALFKRKLKEEDPLALALMEISILVSQSRSTEAIRKGAKLFSALADKPGLARYLFAELGLAYFIIGDLESAENHILRALEISEQIGDPDMVMKLRLRLIHHMICRGDYETAYRELIKRQREVLPSQKPVFDYIMAIHAIETGKHRKCIEILEPHLKTIPRGELWMSMLDTKADALRFLGRLDEASETLIESARLFQDTGMAYSAFPVAKALNLAWFAGTKSPPPNLVKKSLKLAQKGSWGERAAAREIEAFLTKNEAEIAEGLLEAAEGYRRVYQNMEAYLSGISSAYLAWRTDNPVLFKALKFLAPSFPQRSPFRNDPILGDFLNRIEPLLIDAKYGPNGTKGIRAFLIGKLRVSVNGKEINPLEWRSRKAAMFLIYLLLSPKHRIADDHLFYLLWPRKRYNRANRELLYQAASFARRAVGDKDLITHKYDFYQLEDVWTDLSELEDLVIRAESSREPNEKEGFLAKARELAGDELLPEFPYDPYIDEHRQYYKRIRKRALVE